MIFNSRKITNFRIDKNLISHYFKKVFFKKIKKRGDSPPSEEYRKRRSSEETDSTGPPTKKRKKRRSKSKEIIKPPFVPPENYRKKSKSESEEIIKPPVIPPENHKKSPSSEEEDRITKKYFDLFKSSKNTWKSSSKKYIGSFDSAEEPLQDNKEHFIRFARNYVTNYIDSHKFLDPDQIHKLQILKTKSY